MDTTIFQRFQQIRKTLKLSQGEFGSRLGVTAAAISRIENAQRALTTQMVKVTCKEFGVDENWLLTGNGDMNDEHLESKKNIQEALKLLEDLTPPLQNYAILQMKNLLDVQKTIK